jgi:hypothetical protein
MEVAVIERRYLGNPKSFSDRDQARIGPAKREISVQFNEFADAFPIADGKRFDP